VAVYAVPSFARIVRAAAQPLVGSEFVTAARASGASTTRVLLRHVLPGCWPAILAHTTVMLGSAILLASGLSFLGLGVQPPAAEWGAMLSRGRELLRTAPLGAVAPGVAITMTVLSFSVLGDGLRDATKGRTS
jgi:ABC-type dipeptide/oligopeptide/nickel transport system permease subunit